MKSLFQVLTVLILSTSPCMSAPDNLQISLNEYRRYYRGGHQVNDPAKSEAITRLRYYYHRNPSAIAGQSIRENTSFLALLDDKGHFNDFKAEDVNVSDDSIGTLITNAFNRLWATALAIQNGHLKLNMDEYEKFFRGILYYGRMEAMRDDKSWRFHSSCFAIPSAALGVYFALLPEMEKVESGQNNNTLLAQTCEILKVVALQTWTKPVRNDETDKNVVSVERFRGHVWWVGGNGLCYRSVLQAAVALRSIPMIDVLAEASVQSISMVSQTTYDQSFWIEGFTADGAGWGHGKQCLVWGYPIHGMVGALGILYRLKDTPWERNLGQENIDAFMNYIRGSSWYYYNGYILPCVDRSSMQYNPNKGEIPSIGMVRSLLENWSHTLPPSQFMELNRLYDRMMQRSIDMEGYPDGWYSGTRWFYNNDDLIKKNKDYHIMVNMASVRCDGLEAATGFADEYNFFTNDGMTLFQKEGNEYRPIYGGWDVTAAPGITAREGMDKIVTTTNWRGYCSRFNFAAAATSGNENAAAGFIFEKMNCLEKDEENIVDWRAENKYLYGVRAHKSYFMLGDYFIALGAGITNFQPELKGHIRTTIDQTAKVSDIVLLHAGKDEPLQNGVTTSLKAGGNSPIWLLQKEKFAYAILPGYSSKAYCSIEHKKTDWIRRNRSNKYVKNLPEYVDILSMWIDHGQSPINDVYGYTVYAGSGLPEQRLPFEVLKNDKMIQSVGMLDNTVVGAVFYDTKAKLKTKHWAISVSSPCAVLLELQNDDIYTVTVTDALMDASLKEITVSINELDIQVAMPQGEHCGKPAVTRNVVLKQK